MKAVIMLVLRHDLLNVKMTLQTGRTIMCEMHMTKLNNFCLELQYLQDSN